MEERMASIESSLFAVLSLIAKAFYPVCSYCYEYQKQLFVA
jgi:hypothetical protein